MEVYDDGAEAEENASVTLPCPYHRRNNYSEIASQDAGDYSLAENEARQQRDNRASKYAKQPDSKLQECRIRLPMSMAIWTVPKRSDCKHVRFLIVSLGRTWPMMMMDMCQFRRLDRVAVLIFCISKTNCTRRHLPAVRSRRLLSTWYSSARYVHMMMVPAGPCLTPVSRTE